MFHILNQICVGDAVVPKPRMSAPASATQKSGIKRGKRPLPMQSVITYDEDGSYHDSADADFQELPTEGQTSILSPSFLPFLREWKIPVRNIQCRQ
jgi:hypothetical protein